MSRLAGSPPSPLIAQSSGSLQGALPSSNFEPNTASPRELFRRAGSEQTAVGTATPSIWPQLRGVSQLRETPTIPWILCRLHRDSAIEENIGPPGPGSTTKEARKPPHINLPVCGAPMWGHLATRPRWGSFPLVAACAHRHPLAHRTPAAVP